MRKALMLVLLLLSSGLFLYGCGSGGSNNPVSTNPGGGSQPSSVSASTFTLNLVDSANNSNTATGMAMTGIYSAGTSTTPPTDVRVVIRKFLTESYTSYDCIYDDNGDLISCGTQTHTNTSEIYRDIQDVKYAGGGSVAVGIPQGTGYVIDVITNLSSSGTHTILKYGQGPSVDVTPTSTSAQIIMNRVGDVLNMIVPDTVISRGKYNITLNNALPFAPVYTMSAIFSNGTDTPSNSTVTSSYQTCSFTAPDAYSPGNINFQGAFNINNAFLRQGEAPASWKRTFPISGLGEQSYSTLVTLVSVSVPAN